MKIPAIAVDGENGSRLELNHYDGPVYSGRANLALVTVNGLSVSLVDKDAESVRDWFVAYCDRDAGGGEWWAKENL